MRIRFSKLYLYILLAICAVQCQPHNESSEFTNQKPLEKHKDWLQVGFLIMDGVYNTELTAPYDIFQHTKFREGIRPMNVFTVANTLDPIRTFEGLRILPDYNYLTDDYPPIDVLVVPSAEHHLDSDLEDQKMIEFVRRTAQEAQYVTSHCDGSLYSREGRFTRLGLFDYVSR